MDSVIEKKVSSNRFQGSESNSRVLLWTSDVESWHGVNTGKGQDADGVSSVTQGVTFEKCILCKERFSMYPLFASNFISSF